MKIGILGSGAFGSALATVLVNNNNEVLMWTPFEEEKNFIQKTRLIKSLPGVRLNRKIKLTTNIDEVLEFSKLLVIAIPAKNTSTLLDSIKDKFNKDVHICIATKGLEESTGLFMHELVKKYLNTDKICVLSGPSFAIDLFKKSQVGLALASMNQETADIFEKVFENSYFKLRQNKDIIGTEICGSIKNVIAIASGILDALNSSESTRAMLLTEALHDMDSIITNLGGSEKTILSYAGFGDLLLTCNSSKSRNYSFGKFIGKEKNPKKIKKYLSTTTVEGYNALLAIYKLLKDRKIKVPMINLIYDIVTGKKNPKEILSFLIEKE